MNAIFMVWLGMTVLPLMLVSYLMCLEKCSKPIDIRADRHDRDNGARQRGRRNG